MQKHEHDHSDLAVAPSNSAPRASETLGVAKVFPLFALGETFDGVAFTGTDTVRIVPQD